MIKILASEFIGTFALVFCGTGAIVVDEFSKGAVSHVGVAITFGLVIMSMIYSLGDKSGAHFNPAVTLAFSFHRSFPASKILPYLSVQLAGAVAASVILRFLFPGSVLLGATMPAGTEIQSLLMEFVLSFFLMFVILNVSTGSKEVGMFAGLAIGSVVLLEAMFAGPVCGASMNPARSIAPALISGHLEHLWIYLLAPVTGMFAAVGFIRLLK